VIRAALIVAGDARELIAAHFPFPQEWAGDTLPPPRSSSAPSAPAPPSLPPPPSLPRAGTASSRTPYRDPDEARRIAEALDRCGGNQARAAELLGVSYTTLLKRMLAFGLRPPQGTSPYGDPDERQRVVDALAACGGNRAQAAARLGVSRTTLLKRMLAFGLHDPDRRDD
jgi:DNA-binding NtrC family response regulator